MAKTPREEFKVLLDPEAVKWLEWVATDLRMTTQRIVRGQVMRLVDSRDKKLAKKCALEDKAREKDRKIQMLQKKEAVS